MTDKGTRSKLRMEKPVYYDSTDGEAAVIQKLVLHKLEEDARNEGLKVGSWWGSLALAGQSLTFLLTANTDNFKPIFGIDGPAWQAIFILVLIISAVVFVWLSLSLAPKFFKNLFGNHTSGVDRFFDQKRKI